MLITHTFILFIDQMCAYMFDYIDGLVFTITMVIESNHATNNLYRNRILFWQKNEMFILMQK